MVGSFLGNSESEIKDEACHHSNNAGDPGCYDQLKIKSGNVSLDRKLFTFLSGFLADGRWLSPSDSFLMSAHGALP